MNRDNLIKAIAEANRFIDKANKLLVTDKSDYFYSSSPKESGATRRASMDLTRSLAELRKPG